MGLGFYGYYSPVHRSMSPDKSHVYYSSKDEINKPFQQREAEGRARTKSFIYRML